MLPNPTRFVTNRHHQVVELESTQATNIVKNKRGVGNRRK